MAAAILDVQMILIHVSNEQDFDHGVMEHFNALDADQDGTISLDDLRRCFGNSIALDDKDIEGQLEPDALSDVVLERFDEDGDGKLNWSEFLCLYTEITLCLARGIDGLPVLVGLQDGSPLLKAFVKGKL